MEIKQLVVGVFLTNCYLLISKGEMGIIDPGGNEQKILQEIKKTKALPKYIINTHYHFDHSSANKIIKKETGAQILIHQDEKKFINFQPDKFLKEGDEIKIGKVLLKVIQTSGHSQGSICLLNKDFIFTGDTLFKDGYGRIDLPGGSAEKMNESLDRLKKFFKAGMTIFPGHGEIFKVI